MDIESIIGTEFSGVISVTKDNKICFQKAYGYADKANKVPNEIDTKFGTASTGKAFVATAILKLIEQQKLELTSCIGDILTFNLKQIDPEITIAQLLNHTSGIPDYFDESVMDDYEELWITQPSYLMRKSRDLIPLFIDKPMLYPKGEKFQYNNTGYVVLGLVIEEITGYPFDTYLEQAIFSPCKMHNTGYYELDRMPAKCAYSYIYDEENKEYRTNIFTIEAKGSGAGGAFTNVLDVMNFWQHLLNKKIINEELLQKMVTPQIKENEYGYGLWLIDGKVAYFQGSDPGVDCISSYNMETNLCITILSNISFDVDSLHEKLESYFSKQFTRF